MSQNEQRKEILRQFLNEVWSDGDARSGGQVCRADLHDSSCSRRSVGEEATRPAGYKERVRTSRASFPNQRFDVQELSADGKAVVVTWRWPATHQGPLVGSPASGKAIRMSGATVYCFDQMRLGESAGRRAETAYLSAKGEADGAREGRARKIRASASSQCIFSGLNAGMKRLAPVCEPRRFNVKSYRCFIS